MKNQIGSKTPMQSKLEKNIKVKFYITGFGPFQGVTYNPTTALIERLKKPPQFNSEVSIESEVLETSVCYVKKKMDHVFQKIKESNTNETISCKHHHILLHLGVSTTSKTIQVERFAYNDLTFRVPDETGYKPNQVCIVENSELKLGDHLETRLNLVELTAGNGALAVVSTDPGRFVCNFTYFYSLHHSLTLNVSECSGSRHVDALFVHVPLFSEIDEETQYSFLLDLIRSICNSIRNGDGAPQG